MQKYLAQQYELIYQQALQMQEQGRSRNEILDYLASAADNAVPGTVASILLLDDEGLLRNGSSPQLPSDYLKAIDRIRPNPNLGTCAAAAATGKIVLTEDFNADNKWAELRHLPQALGFVGAWSMPIKTEDGRVLGTFGTYYREKRRPSPEEIQGMELLASAVARVVDKSSGVPA